MKNKQYTLPVGEHILKFLTKVENLIENDFAKLTISTEFQKCYKLMICKPNGKMHKHMKCNKIKHNIHNGFVYENGYENLINFISFNSMFKRNFGVSLCINITEFEKVPFEKKLYYKIYGFYIHSEVYQLPAKDVCASYSTCVKTGNSLKHDNYDIYCGEGDDQICGFDLN